MRAELSVLWGEARDTLEDVRREHLTPTAWQGVEASLRGMSEALDRGDHETFRRELYQVEDLIPVERAPRALAGATGAPEPVLEQTVVLLERIGAEDTSTDQAEEPDEQ